MSKARLCVDIDNVVARTDAVMRQGIRDFTNGRVNLAYHHIIEFDYHRCQDDGGAAISKEEWKAIHDLFSEDRYLMRIEPVEEARRWLQELSQRFVIHFATSRLPKARKSTVAWLEQHGFPPHRLHFLSHGEKHVSLCGFGAAVEDHYEQAVDFAKAGTPCYLITHPWNKDKPPVENVCWVKDWTELASRVGA